MYENRQMEKRLIRLEALRIYFSFISWRCFQTQDFNDRPNDEPENFDKLNSFTLQSQQNVARKAFPLMWKVIGGDFGARGTEKSSEKLCNRPELIINVNWISRSVHVLLIYLK